MTKKNFGTSIGVKSGGMGDKPQFQVPLTTDQKFDNIEQNLTARFTEHANALNAIAMWIAEQDEEVNKEGNVVKWALKRMEDGQTKK